LRDERFGGAIVNTLYFTAASVPLTMGLGLLIALLLNNQIRARGFFRTLFYLPVVTPLVIAAIIWKWVYEVDFGLANYYLQRLGLIDEPLRWLSDPTLAMPAVIVMIVWKAVGFNMIIYLAGLQAIPNEYYEAADVDGAGPWQRFRRITLPLVAPTTLFLLVLNMIGSMKSFEQLFVMTQGGPPGPGGATTTVVYWIYQQAFVYFRMGYASALAYVLFILMFALAMVQFRWFTRSAEGA
jgi:multiple sugar transport system permease protein